MHALYAALDLGVPSRSTGQAACLAGAAGHRGAWTQRHSVAANHARVNEWSLLTHPLLHVKGKWAGRGLRGYVPAGVRQRKKETQER